MVKVRVLRKMKQPLITGFVKLLNRDMQNHNTIWVSIMNTVEAFPKIQGKPSNGSERLQLKNMLMLKQKWVI